MHRSDPVTTHEFTYTILLQPEPDGGFTVTCPSLPDLEAYGATLDTARAMAAGAIGRYLEDLRKAGAPVPESDPTAGGWAERMSLSFPAG